MQRGKKCVKVTTVITMNLHMHVVILAEGRNMNTVWVTQELQKYDEMDIFLGVLLLATFN